jgi:hypothetical protein
MPPTSIFESLFVGIGLFVIGWGSRFIGFDCQVSGTAVLPPHMKLHVAVTVNKLNVEHRTSNIDGAMLYLFKSSGSQNTEPQPATSRSTWSSQPKGSV